MIQEIVSQKLHYFLGAYISFFLFMICVAADWSIGGLLFKALAVCSFGMFLLSDIRVHKITFEKTILLLFGMLLGLLMLGRGKLQGEFTVFNITFVVFMVIFAIIYFVNAREKIGITNWLVQNKLILLIIFLFILLSMEVIDAWFMWDDRTYYAQPGNTSDIQGVLYNFNADFADVDGLYLAGHVSIGYSLWLILFQLIKEGSASVQIANIILAEISIFAYYQILRKFLNKKISNNWLALATIPYAASPFVLGIIGCLNLDSATMYVLVIFLACSLYRFKALEWVFAFFLCFTKEPAVIYYVVYVVAKVVCDYLKEHSFCWSRLFRSGFGNIQNYIYALPVILWIVLKLLKPIWGGAVLWSDEGINCFGIDLPVIVMKLKQIFLLNFNWVLWVSILIGGIILWIRKTKMNKTVLVELFPICCVGIVVILFSCLYITWTHVRYIVPVIPALYLTATIIIANLEMSRLFPIGNVILSVLLFVQSFYAIDPVMNFVFSTFETGNGNVYIMRPENSSRVRTSRNLSDTIVYNRQYIYWQETLIQTLKKAGYDGTMLIVFPEGVDCEAFSLLGQMKGIVMWDTQSNKFEYVNDNIDPPAYCRNLKFCNVSGMDQMYDGADMLYIIPRWADIDLEFISDKKLIRYGEVDNKGFSIRYFVMDVKNGQPLPEGSYVISPKQDGALGLYTTGEKRAKVSMKETAKPLRLEKMNELTYHIIFEEYGAALDVPGGNVDNNGTVHVWPINSTKAQEWTLKEVDGYYMICFNDYALTYDLGSNSIALSKKSGEDNQLWSFSDQSIK